jgi:competence protein ComEA
VWGGWIVFVAIAAPLLVQLGRRPALEYPPPPQTAHASSVPTRYRSQPLTFLNTAHPDSLCLLPGIGPVLAARIADARSGQRPFISWDDLRARVSGIGSKTIARLRHAAEPLPRPVGFWIDNAGVASD